MFIKSVDEKLKCLGFKKRHETIYETMYERWDSETKHFHRVKIEYDPYDRKIPMLKSYDPDVYIYREGGYLSVGLTRKELKLFYKKMKQKERE